MNRMRKIVALCIAVGGAAAWEGSSQAVEPYDNTNMMTPLTWYGAASTYLTNGAQTWWGASESISPAGDVDYHMLVCGVGLIRQVKIHFTNASGDLDMEVYRPDGTLVGGSYSTADEEVVTIASPNRNALVLKTYGYNNATNTYSIDLYCDASRP